MSCLAFEVLSRQGETSRARARPSSVSPTTMLNISSVILHTFRLGLSRPTSPTPVWASGCQSRVRAGRATSPGCSAARPSTARAPGSAVAFGPASSCLGRIRGPSPRKVPPWRVGRQRSSRWSKQMATCHREKCRPQSRRARACRSDDVGLRLPRGCRIWIGVALFHPEIGPTGLRPKTGPLGSELRAVP